MAVKLTGLITIWCQGCQLPGAGRFEFFFENQFEKFQKILNLVPPRQRASQIENFQKILNLVPPWSPEAYIPSLRTWVDSGLGGTNLKIFRKFSNWYGVSG
jgi:hypothetical protein